MRSHSTAHCPPCLSCSLRAVVQEVVNGHADAFTGKTFVFSGVLPSLFRDAARDLVLSHGGRVTGIAHPHSPQAAEPSSQPAPAAMRSCLCSCTAAAVVVVS